MSKAKRQTVYLHGKVYWAKIFGAPRTNYNEDGREWGFEFEPDGESLATLRDHGLEDRFKGKYKKDGTVRKNYENRDNPFLNLRRNEFKSDGDKNDPIRVVAADDQPWNPEVELGNETEVDLKVRIVDYGAGKKKGIYPLALRVLELVPFQRQDFAPLAEDDSRRSAVKDKYHAPDFEKDFGIENDTSNNSDVEPDDISNETPPENDDLDDDVPLT